jgi:hypothetical protein
MGVKPLRSSSHPNLPPPGGKDLQDAIPASLAPEGKGIIYPDHILPIQRLLPGGLQAIDVSFDNR